MTNIIPFPAARRDGDTHQVKLLRIMDQLTYYDNAADAIDYQAQVLERLANALQRKIGPAYIAALRQLAATNRNTAAQMRSASRTAHADALEALAAGERFLEHHVSMAAAVQQMRQAG